MLQPRMKIFTLAPTRLLRLVLLFVVSPLQSVPAYASPVERKILEHLLHVAGREALERSTKEAIEQSVAAAVRTLGKEGAENLIQRGGLPLVRVAMEHGDDFWKLASRVPESAHYLAAKPAEALALARKFGDHAVRIETRVPGLAQKAALHFGPESLEVLAKASPGQVTQLVGYAEKAANPEVRKKLFDLWLKRGAGILRILDRNKTLILTGGLTMALLDVASGVSEGIRDSIPEIPSRIPPEAPLIFSTKIGTGFQWSVVLLSAAVSYRLIAGARKRTFKAPHP